MSRSRSPEMTAPKKRFRLVGKDFNNEPIYESLSDSEGEGMQIESSQESKEKRTRKRRSRKRKKKL